MFINFSNHPSEYWSKKQLEAAAAYGEIIDIPFPNVSPYATEEDVSRLAGDCFGAINRLSPDCVLCAGEFTLTKAVVGLLQKNSIKTVSACSERVCTERVDENGDTEKTANYKFVKFREYV